MASITFVSLLVVTLALVESCHGQEDYQPAQGVADVPAPQLNIQHQPPQFNLNNFGGNHEAFLASFQAQQVFADQQHHQPPVQQDGQNYQNQYPIHGIRPGQQDQQLVTKVFVKPDGGITTVQIPQNFHFSR